jgi:hypothetical protein
LMDMQRWSAPRRDLHDEVIERATSGSGRPAIDSWTSGRPVKNIPQ